MLCVCDGKQCVAERPVPELSVGLFSFTFKSDLMCAYEKVVNAAYRIVWVELALLSSLE